MAIMHNKKGVFFTLISMLILTIVFTDLLSQNDDVFVDASKLVNIRTTTLNTFVLGLEEDIERGYFIASFRALIGAENYVTANNVFLNDARANITEAIMNGTIGETTVPLMDQSTVPEWGRRVENEARKVGILINFSFDSTVIDQTSPWLVDFIINVSFNVTDVTGTASFERSRFFVMNISIIGLKDPIHPLYTNGVIRRNINRTPYEENFVNNVDTTNLQDHINSKYYSNSTGPNYLMRLEADLSEPDDGTGIESFVILPELEALGLPVFERTAIDYLYLVNQSPPHNIINETFESWLRIDNNHVDKYNVSQIII